MHALSWLILTIAANSNSPANPEWEKVFDATSHGAVGTLKATGRETWIAGGPWGLATANGSDTTVEPTHGHAVLGLFVESPTSAYAFGEGELIWHFDGKRWTEEHVGPLPPRTKRRPFADHLLYLSYYNGAAPHGPLVAFGLSLVLVKQPDGTWAPPPDVDKNKLLELGQLGPQVSRPEKCDPAGWHWFGRNRGALYCHDRRTFVFDTDRVIPKGKLPSACYDGLHSLVEAKGELYASCSTRTLWKTEGEAWRRIDPPKEKGPKEIPSISVADGCLFIAGTKSVWRRCDQ